MASRSFPSATVLIVDDFAGWLAQVRHILETRPEWTIVGEAYDGPAAVEKAAEFQPDIIVLDITLPALSRIEAAKLIRQQSPNSLSDAERRSGYSRCGACGPFRRVRTQGECW